MARQFNPESVATPNETRRLERSSWKAEAIRKGQLKISGPLPVVNGVAEEESLAKRHTDSFVTTIHTEASHQDTGNQRHGSLDIQTGAQQRAETAAASIPEESDHEHLTTDVQGETPEPSSMLPNRNIGHHSPGHRTPRIESPTPRKDKKRKSGLKHVFKKIFSRRSKETRLENLEPNPTQDLRVRAKSSPFNTAKRLSSPQDASPERNDGESSSMVRPLPREHKSQPSARAFSPLASHLPFPMNVNAPQEESLTVEAQPRVHRRRASVPSVVFSSADAAALNAYWRSDRMPALTTVDSSSALSPEYPAIGVALSSPTQLKRRSRSAGALHQLPRYQADETPIVRISRRRSAEIRFWRTSVAGRAVSAYSEPKVTSRDDETVKRFSPHESATERETVHLDPEQAAAFNFGNLGADTQGSDQQTPTMTEGASAPSYDDTDDRDGLGESPFQQTPDRLSHPGSHPIHQSIVLQEPPRRKPTIGDSSDLLALPVSAVPECYSTSDQNSLLTPTPPSDSAQFPPREPSREGSADFAPSSRQETALDLTTLTVAEQIASLHDMLKQERNARRMLEDQVHTLRREMNEFRMQTYGATVTSQFARDYNQTRRSTRSTMDNNRSLSQDYTPPNSDRIDKRQTVVSRFSRFEDSDEDERPSAGVDSHDGAASSDSLASTRSPDVWETPREESSPFGLPFGVAQAPRPVAIGDQI